MRKEAGEAAVLGIDLGTTEVKAGLVTLDGRLLGLARAGYRTDTDPAAGRAEQDPEAWWGAVTTIVRKLAADAGAEVLAIGVDGHGPSLVAVDEAGRPTRPSIIWSDGRAAAEQEELARLTGLQGWALAGLPAALWVERNEPAVGGGDALVPRHVGVPRLPPDRCRRDEPRGRPAVPVDGCPRRRRTIRAGSRPRLSRVTWSAS